MKQTQQLSLDSIRSRVLALVASLPRGRVTTYGTLGASLGTGPRQVARVLATLTGDEVKTVPWHRVVAEPGRVSIPNPRSRREQIARLKREGVRVDAKGKVQDFEAVLHVPQWVARRGSGRAKKRAPRRTEPTG